jgi:hypothetical protein
VKDGDTLVGIARAFGRPSWAYSELVGANLDKPLSSLGVPPGLSLRLERLDPGQKLYLPVSWLGDAFPSPDPNPWKKPDGLETQLDPTSVLILNHVQYTWEQMKGAPGQFPQEAAGAVYNAVNQWWRAFNGVDAKPSYSDVHGLINSALIWWHTYGSKMDQQLALVLPWNAVPWTQVPWASLSKAKVDWKQIAQWCDQNYVPGKVTPNTSPRPWATMDWKQPIPGNVYGNGPESWWSMIDWAGTPWGQVPWGCVGWQKVNWPFVLQDPSQSTIRVITEQALIMGPKPQEDGGGGQEEGGPGPTGDECPPGQIVWGGKCTPYFNTKAEAEAHCGQSGMVPYPVPPKPGVPNRWVCGEKMAPPPPKDDKDEEKPSSTGKKLLWAAGLGLAALSIGYAVKEGMKKR